MAQWRSNGDGAPGWNLTNGVMTIVPGAGGISSWQSFEDIQLHLEFRFLSNSPLSTAENQLPNSGVFLQGQFEIQILDSFNRPFSGLNDNGAIWSIRDANSNASLPGGQWETFDITFRAARWIDGVKAENARVTLWWNGTLAHDNVEIPRPTAGGAPPESPAPGPISLQDLVGIVQFRNIWVLPLTHPRAPGPAAATLVPAGSSWRYLDDGSDQAAAWRAPSFDDSPWSNSLAQFGYGDGDEITLIRSNRLNGTRIQTTYFRQSFTVTNAWAITNLALGVLRDDGAIVYLNGIEVFRSNLPQGPIGYADWALAPANNADETRFFTTNVAPSLLVNGTNWLAVEVHQQSATSSDVSFDLRLTGLVWQPPAIAAESSGPNTLFTWPAAPGGFTLESTSDLGPAALWRSEKSVSIVASNGWNHVTVPNEPGSRFYRLVRP